MALGRHDSRGAIPIMGISFTTTIRACAVGIIAGSLFACASTPKTFSNAAPDFDLTQHSTFGFYDNPATDNGDYESMVSSFLKVAIAQEFDRRGLSYTDDAPELIVNFYINTKEKVKSRSVPTSGGYYSYRDPFYDPWGGYGVHSGYETRIEQYTEGTLNIDVVNAKTKKLVWEGAGVGRVTDSKLNNLEQTIDSSVAAIFSNFPN